MFHLRLCKGLSYLGIVRATKAEPDVYVQEEEKAKALVASGYFEMVTSEAEKIQPLAGTIENAENMFGEAEEAEDQEESELMELQKKSKPELIEYANVADIDITGCKTKDDIYQKIVEAIARVAASRVE